MHPGIGSAEIVGTIQVDEMAPANRHSQCAVAFLSIIRKQNMKTRKRKRNEIQPCQRNQGGETLAKLEIIK